MGLASGFPRRIVTFVIRSGSIAHAVWGNRVRVVYEASCGSQQSHAYDKSRKVFLLPDGGQYANSLLLCSYAVYKEQVVSRV